MWEQLLFFSGGSLNLSKCSWYIMYWDWKQGRPILRKLQDDDSTVVLRRGESESKTQIKRLETNKSSPILGVIQTPEGDFADHIAMLKSKADKYAGYLRSPRLTAFDVKIFHRTMYGPAMRYSLPAVAVDEEELETIQTKILPIIVQKLGHSSKLPTAIRHGPTEMGGGGAGFDGSSDRGGNRDDSFLSTLSLQEVPSRSTATVISPVVTTGGGHS